jgi:hypothetical protein
MIWTKEKRKVASSPFPSLVRDIFPPPVADCQKVSPGIHAANLVDNLRTGGATAQILCACGRGRKPNDTGILPRLRDSLNALNQMDRARSRLPARGCVVEQCRHVIRIENRAESNAQIVVRPGVEIDFVAHVQAQANGSEMCLQASARIENSV